MVDKAAADAFVAEVLRDIELRDGDAQRDLAMLDREFDEIAVAAINRAFDERAVDVLPVQVVFAPTDVHWSPIRHGLRSLGPVPLCQDRWCVHRRGGCDLDRVGVLRERPARRPDGQWSVYIEEMGPGDDGNPSRYLTARHIAVLPAAEEVTTPA